MKPSIKSIYYIATGGFGWPIEEAKEILQAVRSGEFNNGGWFITDDDGQKVYIRVLR